MPESTFAEPENREFSPQRIVVREQMLGHLMVEARVSLCKILGSMTEEEERDFLKRLKGFILTDALKDEERVAKENSEKLSGERILAREEILSPIFENTRQALVSQFNQCTQADEVGLHVQILSGEKRLVPEISETHAGHFTIDELREFMQENNNHGSTNHIAILTRILEEEFGKLIEIKDVIDHIQDLLTIQGYGRTCHYELKDFLESKGVDTSKKRFTYIDKDTLKRQKRKR